MDGLVASHSFHFRFAEIATPVPADSVTVSVIIVTHNSSAALSDCLNAIPVACARYSYEIIVVDNQSADDSVALVRHFSPDVLVIENSANIGFGRACNLAAESARGEFLLLLNPDAMLDPLSVDYLIETYRSRSTVGVAVPRLRFPSGKFQASCRKLPTIGNMIFSRGSAIAKVFAKSLGDSSPYTLPDYSITTPVPAVAGTIALIRRDLFDRAKGFDPRFFLFMEDTDLCARLGQSGYEHLFVPAASAVHMWGEGSSAGRVSRIWRHHMSVWKYFLKHFPNGFSVVLLPILLLINGLISTVFPARREEI